ncbi:hypothetical protein [Methylosinus sp. Sm6]|jgi:hypothetical protein|uniref:hypothetical protein n=1 Tax=Methylosinus sp. Sm6 TaxID=2866948 RepID=UPI001C992C57|nr:hypothetical protein [Methylosinus sp. Sm6]MBY6240362.1 hypothetical protein [Methylosinus sp. Sm6]
MIVGPWNLHRFSGRVTKTRPRTFCSTAIAFSETSTPNLAYVLTAKEAGECAPHRGLGAALAWRSHDDRLRSPALLPATDVKANIVPTVLNISR